LKSGRRGRLWRRDIIKHNDVRVITTLTIREVHTTRIGGAGSNTSRAAAVCFQPLYQPASPKKVFIVIITQLDDVPRVAAGGVSRSFVT
jgi:hypothetical protein